MAERVVCRCGCPKHAHAHNSWGEPTFCWRHQCPCKQFMEETDVH